MKTLKKFNLKDVSLMTDSQMKLVTGGIAYDVDSVTGDNGSGGKIPSRCQMPGCKDASNCKNGQMCVTWSDCPSDSTYGQRRCN